MKKILRFEFDKLFRQRSFYVCTIITAIFILISALIDNSLIKSAEGFVMTGWEFAANTISNASLQMMLAIFIALFVCDDFTHNTMKNIISKGYDRQSVYIGKYISSLCGMLIIYCVDVLLSFGIGSALWGMGKPGALLKAIVAQLVVLIAYHAMFYAISIFLSKAGGAIAIGIVGPMMIGLLLSLADSLLEPKYPINNFWLASIMNTASDSSATTGSLTKALLLCVVYIVAFFASGLLRFKKKQF